MKKILSSFLVTLLPFGAAAQSSDIIQKIETDWKKWTTKHKIKSSALTLRYRGDIVSYRILGMQKDEAIIIGSTSKSITAMCIRNLVQKGKLEYNTRLQDIFGTSFQSKSIPNASANIQIRQLLTHTSGLNKDSTQGIKGVFDARAKSPRHTQIAAQAIARGPNGSTGYFYNNENYAILGAVIEHITKRPYFEYCKAAVLNPISATTAKMHPKVGFISSAGGWQMNAKDLSKFFDTYYGAGSKNATSFGSYPGARMTKPMKNGTYGMGVIRADFSNKSVDFHNGLLCLPWATGGSVMATHGDWTLAATFSSCLGDAGMTLVKSMARHIP